MALWRPVAVFQFHGAVTSQCSFRATSPFGAARDFSDLPYLHGAALPLLDDYLRRAGD